MPKTKNFSDHEKRDAMDLLEIHGDINAVHLLTGINPRTLRRWQKKARRQQNTTLSEKSFSLSDQRTKSEKPATHPQPSENRAPAPSASSSDFKITDDDFQRLLYVRHQLLDFACRLAGDLHPDDPDVNLRTMSLSRTLERIYWLDEKLCDDEDETDDPDKAAPPNRMEFVVEGQAREHPPWHDASREQGD